MPLRKVGPPDAVMVKAKSAAAWRRWLTRHHDRCHAALLIYAKKGSGEPSLTWEESVEEALCFGWVDGVRGALDATHFSVRFTPRKARSIWSKRNIALVERLISEKRMQPAGLAAYAHGKKRGAHQQSYAIRDDVVTPVELTLALAQNRRGRRAFEAATPGQRKGWARWVGSAKAEATRTMRAKAALLLLTAGRKAGETDNQAARRGVASKASILAERPRT